MPKKESKFKQKIIEICKLIPHGKVVSYGQVALMAGLPKAAQAVGQVLRQLEDTPEKSQHTIPWQRIVNNAGRVSIKGCKYHNAPMQKALLEKEGVKVNKDLTFDIEYYRWRPDPKILNKLELDERYIEKIIEQYLY